MAIFEPAFEEIVLGLLATNRKFWGSFGAHLTPDYFSEGSAQGLFKVLTEIAAEVKWPGGSETATQGLRQEMESGRMSTPIFRSACRILFNADLMPGDEGATRYMLKAILQKKKRLETTTEIVEAVAAKKGQEGVGELGKKLDAVERIGDSDESPGMELDQELFDAIDDAQVRQRITTGVPELDVYLSGGLPRGSTGIVIGSSGGGKSIAMSQFAAAAIMKGIPTYYITLEVDVPTVGARILSPMLGISIDNCFLYSKKLPTIIRDRRLKLAPIIIKDMPGLTTTASGCIEWIKRTIDQKGQRPSLICYDYLDRFGGVAKATRQQKNSYEHFADVTQELHDFGQAYGHASWTAVQSTRQQKRSRGAAQNITLDDAADSLHKIRIADVVLTLNLSTELDPIANKTTQYIQGYLAKNRHGPGDKRMTKTPVNYVFGQVFPTNVFPPPVTFVNISEVEF